MVSDEPPVLIAVVQMVLLTAAGLGLDRAALLESCGVTEAELADRDGYVPLSSLVRLGEAIVARRPAVNIGLAALDHVRVSMLGVLGYVVSHCATLGDALGEFVRYQNLLSTAVRWHIEASAAEHVRLRIDAAAALQRLAFPLETQVGAWVVLGRRLTASSWSPARLCLRHHPRGPAEEFTARLGCAVEFGASMNALELPRAALALPVVGARPELQTPLARLVQTLHPGPSPRAGHGDRVRELLREGLPQGLTSKDEAARRLGVSPRTLTRRLRDEGLTFRELREDVRQQLARAWLADPSIAIHEVAYLLGYSEPSAFHRSFRRWTGQTPTAWRQRGRGAG